MTAAVIIPTMVQIEEVKSSAIYGTTPRKLMRLYMEGPKAAQNDWFLLSTYIGATDAANVLNHHGVTRATGDSTAIDVLTYDYDDYKMDLTSTDTGTTFIEVEYYTE